MGRKGGIKDRRLKGVREQDDVGHETEDEEKRRKDCRPEQVNVKHGWEETEDEGERRKDCRLEGGSGQVNLEPGWEGTEDEEERRGMKHIQNRKTRKEDLHSTARPLKLNNRFSGIVHVCVSEVFILVILITI